MADPQTPQDPYAQIAKPLTPAAPQTLPASKTTDPYATIAKPLTPPVAPPPGVAGPAMDAAPMADPGEGKPYVEPETKGPLHQIGGFFQGVGENVGGAVKGIHDLFQEPQTPEELALHTAASSSPGTAGGPLLGRLALGGYRLLHGINATMGQMDEAGKAGAKAKEQGEGIPGQLLADAEKEPFIGKAVNLSEHGEYGKALGDLLTTVATMRGGRTAVKELPEAAAGGEAAIPKAPIVAGTELPETVGQAASRVNPTGIGSDVKGIEDVAKKIPGSGGLRDVSTAQQAAARDILTKKSESAVPGNQEKFGNAPESIEQNAASAAEAARKAGSAKYGEIATQAAEADFTKPVEAAHEILTDEGISKVLPKSTRDALTKVGAALSDREEIAQQIYGKPFGDLDASKQTEVGKAMKSNPTPADPFGNILKARSELADAANGMKDAADRFQAHKALDQFDQAIEQALKDHDAKTSAKPAVTSAAAPPAVTPTAPSVAGATSEAEKLFQDRRVDTAERKRVESMSPAELKEELLTSPVTGLPNRRAFDEAGKSPVVAMSDADGLKAFNDKFGYAAGNQLLQAKADALKEAGLDAYHDKGDEFLFRGASPEELQSKLDKARDILRNTEIDVELKDGAKKTFKGADFSYGTGTDTTEAESGLKAHKSQREAAGERARGEFRGITEAGSETSGVNQSPSPQVAADEGGLSGKLTEAKRLWSQKYAFEQFRDGLQDLMRDQPHTGPREINGAAFQKLINDLDPRGSKGSTPLQRMFPGDAASVKDLHDLADFMGKNQSSAGGMSSAMAKLRILGLKESALGLIANTAGFSYLLSKPGVARAILTAVSAGKNVAKASAAIGQINHAVSGLAPDESTEAQGIPEGRIAVSVPGGTTYHFPDQQSADEFKKSAGIQ